MEEIEELLAREKIKQQLYLYCKGVDQRDWALVRSCFGDEHQHHHGSFTGSADKFIEFAKPLMAMIKVTHHSIANVMVNFNEDGLAASSESYFSAVHLVEKPSLPHMPFYKEGMSDDMDWAVEGSYADRWVYRDERWLIIERTAAHRWERIEPTKQR